jgi:hypothetical protein
MIKKFYKKLFPDKATLTVYSEEERDKVIPVIKWQGVQYYKYKDNIDMRYGRYMYLATFLQAVENRMTLEVLDAYLDKLEGNLSGGKGHINIGESMIVIKQIRTRTRIIFDEELAYNLTSCIFFTDDEPLDTYSMEKNKAKIEAWRSSGALNFFMLEPVRTLLGLTHLSETDLINYLKKSRPIVEALTSAMQTAASKDH